MTVSLVVAMAKNRVIGKDNDLPWRLKPDLKRFRKITMGHAIIMGRKTYESIGRPLDGRKNIVITGNPAFHPDGVTVVGDIEAALRAAGDGETMVIGGATVYEQTLSRANRIYLTLIDGCFEGDAYFPEIDPRAWKEIKREVIGAGIEAEFGYSFITLERVREKVAGDL